MALNELNLAVSLAVFLYCVIKLLFALCPRFMCIFVTFAIVSGLRDTENVVLRFIFFAWTDQLTDQLNTNRR